MHIALKGHNFTNEIQTVCQIFLPNDKYYFIDEGNTQIDLFIKSETSGDSCKAELYEKGRLLKANAEILSEVNETAVKRAVKRTAYQVLREYTGLTPPWGNFTGIRPQKIVHDMRKTGFNDNEIMDLMTDVFSISQKKAELCFKVANCEKPIIESNMSNDFSVYIGISFCPTRCDYCSFISYPISFYKNDVEVYMDCLEKEMYALSGFVKGKTLKTIYIGGGTPTVLNESQLDRLLFLVNSLYRKGLNIEFTVESGRPDTITKEKLEIMKKHGVTRISVNPQTTNDNTLEKIGRKCTNDEFLQAFNLAREEGFDNINVDIIVGLPEETVKDVENTINAIKELKPESLTVHTLAVKRASKLKETQGFKECEKIDDMMETAENGAIALEMHPYYMYRQKNMVGHYENIGYCKKGYECSFNINMMGDCQTVLAFGAGGVTKLYTPSENRIERAFNVKDVKEYINRIDEMIERKTKLLCPPQKNL